MWKQQNRNVTFSKHLWDFDEFPPKTKLRVVPRSRLITGCDNTDISHFNRLWQQTRTLLKSPWTRLYCTVPSCSVAGRDLWRPLVGRATEWKNKKPNQILDKALIQKVPHLTVSDSSWVLVTGDYACGHVLVLILKLCQKLLPTVNWIIFVWLFFIQESFLFSTS